MIKNKIQLISLSVFVFTLLMLFMPGINPVGAADIVGDVCSQPTANGEVPSVCKDDLSGSDRNPIFGPEGIATKGIQIFTFAVGLTAIVVLMINSVRLMTANGDASSVNSARNGILYAVIGLVIAMSGQLLVTFIISKL